MHTAQLTSFAVVPGSIVVSFTGSVDVIHAINALVPQSVIVTVYKGVRYYLVGQAPQHTTPPAQLKSTSAFTSASLAGVVIGCVLGAIVLLVAAALLIRRRRDTSTSKIGVVHSDNQYYQQTEDPMHEQSSWQAYMQQFATMTSAPSMPAQSGVAQSGVFGTDEQQAGSYYTIQQPQRDQHGYYTLDPATHERRYYTVEPETDPQYSAVHEYELADSMANVMVDDLGYSELGADIIDFIRRNPLYAPSNTGVASVNPLYSADLRMDFGAGDGTSVAATDVSNAPSRPSRRSMIITHTGSDRASIDVEITEALHDLRRHSLSMRPGATLLRSRVMSVDLQGKVALYQPMAIPPALPSVPHDTLMQRISPLAALTARLAFTLTVRLDVHRIDDMLGSSHQKMGAFVLCRAAVQHTTRLTLSVKSAGSIKHITVCHHTSHAHSHSAAVV